MSGREPFVLGGESTPAGRRGEIHLPIATLPTGSPVTLPIIVTHGERPGPTVWLNAAIHGDEIGGVAIIREVLEAVRPADLAGTLIAVPVVNVHGFLVGDRYLPDRRDLNRSFPGSAKGSLARRLAHLLMTEVVARCSVGIDLHTASDGRCNLAQVRADLDDPKTLSLATAFGAPIMIHAKVREGSLRGAATKAGATVLLFEGGEALRFDRQAIDHGTAGVLRVLAALDMIAPQPASALPVRRSDTSRWVRTPRSGLVQLDCSLGDLVSKGQLLGRVHDATGRRLAKLTSPRDGMVIGQKMEPLVNRGDALVHIATLIESEIP